MGKFFVHLDLDENHRNVSSTAINGVLYFINRNQPLSKYDGVNLYWASVPQPEQPTAALSSGALTGDYKYIFTYVQYDARGNIIESVASAESATLSPSSQDIDVNLPADLYAVTTKAYNIKRAYANGIQSGVTTINVNFTDPGLLGLTNGMKLEAGDTAYFYDGVTSAYVTREITAVTASSITIAGDAVDVTDDEPISNNLRTAIYRTKASGNDFFLVAEVPWNLVFDGANDPHTTPNTFNDDTSDANLGAQYLYPIEGTEHNITPLHATQAEVGVSYKIAVNYKNRLVLSGADGTPSTVVFSVTNGPEYFPPTNSFLIGQEEPGPITGMFATDRFLLVFKKAACYRVTGSFVSNDITIEKLSATVGCVSQESLKLISYGGRSRVIWLGADGIYESVDGSAPVEVSGSIRPEFDDSQLDAGKVFARERSVAMLDKKARQYWIFVPEEDTTQTGAARVIPTTEPDGESHTLVYDFGLFDRGEEPQWYKWNTVDMSAGAGEFRDVPIWNRRVSSREATVYHKIDREDSYTSFDHDGPIDSHIEFGSLNGGSADLLVKFLRLRLSSFDPIVFDDFTLTVKSYLDYAETDASRVNTETTFAFGPTTGIKRGTQKLNPAKGYALRYRFEHFRAGERAIITAIVTELNSSFAERLKGERENFSNI